jgi:hypothetical protein
MSEDVDWIKLKMAVFWVVAPCNLADVYRHRPDDGRSKHFRNVDKFLLHLGATTQKTVTFTLAAVRT